LAGRNVRVPIFDATAVGKLPLVVPVVLVVLVVEGEGPSTRPFVGVYSARHVTPEVISATEVLGRSRLFW
jgi:hypothetical protein